jgi:DNA-directed RNA polymerase subunit H (RpoH/RPB5)
MAKYKISKENINEFFGFFGKTKKPKDIDTIIKNDPVLQKIDKEIGDLNDKAAERLRKDVDAMKILKKLGIEIK